MAVLHNRISQKELKERLHKEDEPRIIFSFYKYVFIAEPGLFRDELYKGLNDLKVFGRIYVANEGINAQLSVPEQNFNVLKDYLQAIAFLKDVRLNIAVDNLPPLNENSGQGKGFWVLKIKVRRKIVADGITDPAFNMEAKGKYVNAEEFNRLTGDPKTIVVDMRNHYEYEVGHFENAVEVPSDTFREQLPMAVELLKEKKEGNIIMYCTGGIRCEKASAFLLHKGFKNVFHLEGGIINYANFVKTNNLPNKFKGKNFVFDDRLGEQVGSEVISRCHQCGSPCDAHANCANSACHLLFIQCKNCAAAYHKCCSEDCKTIYDMPENEQKIIRKGKMNGMMVFNKSRQRLRPILKK